jgi:hypothetical protein
LITISTQFFYGAVNWLAHQNHTRATTVGPVIHHTVNTLGPIPQVLHANVQNALMSGFLDQTFFQVTLEHAWKQSQDINAHGT